MSNIFIIFFIIFTMLKMDHLNSDGYLFSGLYTYQKERIKLLDNNSVPFPDMAWEIDGKILYDTRSVYTSSYFDVLFRTELTLSLIHI